MAIRQSDEKFLVQKVLPAMLKVEELLLAQDRATDLRLGEEQEWPLTVELTTAIDDIVLRIKRQGSWGWKTINERLESIQQERCEHTLRVPGYRVHTNEQGHQYKEIACERCKLVTGAMSVEETAS